MTYLKLDHIDKTFTRGNATTEVLKDVSLSIEKGEYVARSWIVAWPRAALIKWADARKPAMQAEAA